MYLRKELEKHQKKYFWIGSSYAKAEIADIAYFIDEIKRHMAEKEDKNIKEPRIKISILAKNRSEIEKYLTKAIELKPDLEQAFVIIGNYYYLCQDINNALKTYLTLVEKFPNSKDISTYNSFIEILKKEFSEK